MEKYEFVKELGGSSFGVVSKYSVRNPTVLPSGMALEAGFAVVIKSLPLDSSNEVLVNDAKREVEVMSQIRHPRIVTYLEAFVEDSRLCIVMEYLDGGDMHQLIQSRKTSGVLFTDAEARTYGAAIAEALSFVHGKGIIHRDIKGDNILLDRFGRPYLADFGVATTAGPDGKGHFGTFEKGNHAFLSPEATFASYTGKSDVFSLGALLHYALSSSSRLPVYDERALLITAYSKPSEASWQPPSLPRSVDPDIRDAIMAMMAVDPADRPTAAEAAAWLGHGVRPRGFEAVGAQESPTKSTSPGGSQPTGRRRPGPSYVTAFSNHALSPGDWVTLLEEGVGDSTNLLAGGRVGLIVHGSSDGSVSDTAAISIGAGGGDGDVNSGNGSMPPAIGILSEVEVEVGSTAAWLHPEDLKLVASHTAVQSLLSRRPAVGDVLTLKPGAVTKVASAGSLLEIVEDDAHTYVCRNLTTGAGTDGSRLLTVDCDVLFRRFVILKAAGAKYSSEPIGRDSDDEPALSLRPSSSSEPRTPTVPEEGKSDRSAVESRSTTSRCEDAAAASGSGSEGRSDSELRRSPSSSPAAALAVSPAPTASTRVFYGDLVELVPGCDGQGLLAPGLVGRMAGIDTATGCYKVEIGDDHELFEEGEVRIYASAGSVSAVCARTPQVGDYVIRSGGYAGTLIKHGEVGAVTSVSDIGPGYLRVTFSCDNSARNLPASALCVIPAKRG